MPLAIVGRPRLLFGGDRLQAAPFAMLVVCI